VYEGEDCGTLGPQYLTMMGIKSGRGSRFHRHITSGCNGIKGSNILRGGVVRMKVVLEVVITIW